jgi:hypothetical protein
MRRISDKELQTRIAIQLRVQRGPDKTKLGLHGDLAAETVARNILERCLGGCVVLAPDLVSAGPWGERPGSFGVDEPWPFEKGCRPPK